MGVGVVDAGREDVVQLLAVPGDGVGQVDDRVGAAAPNGVDAFIDLQGPEYVRLAVDLGVAPQRIDTIVPPSWPWRRDRREDRGKHGGTTRQALAETADLVAGGRIDLSIAAAYPLDRVRGAFAGLERGHTAGRPGDQANPPSVNAGKGRRRQALPPLPVNSAGVCGGTCHEQYRTPAIAAAG